MHCLNVIVKNLNTAHLLVLKYRNHHLFLEKWEQYLKWFRLSYRLHKQAIMQVIELAWGRVNQFLIKTFNAVNDSNSDRVQNMFFFKYVLLILPYCCLFSDDLKGLNRLYDDLLTMDMLVYECCVDCSLTFQQLLDMSDIERLCLMMNRVSLSLLEICIKSLTCLEWASAGSSFAIWRHW